MQMYNLQNFKKPLDVLIIKSSVRKENAQFGSDVVEVMHIPVRLGNNYIS